MLASQHVLLAVALMIVYSLAISLHLVRKRVGGVRAGRAKMKRFVANATQDGLPDDMIVAARHYGNTFEQPTLFYALCLAIVVGDAVDMTYAYLAYGYVVARLVHGVIHLGYNNVNHRFLAFAAGYALLIVMTVRFIAGLI